MAQLRAAATDMLTDLARLPALLDKATTISLAEAIKEAEKLAAYAQLIFKISNSLVIAAARQTANLPYDAFLEPSGFVRSSRGKVSRAIVQAAPTASPAVVNSVAPSRAIVQAAPAASPAMVNSVAPSRAIVHTLSTGWAWPKQT